MTICVFQENGKRIDFDHYNVFKESVNHLHMLHRSFKRKFVEGFKKKLTGIRDENGKHFDMENVRFEKVMSSILCISIQLSAKGPNCGKTL